MYVIRHGAEATENRNLNIEPPKNFSPFRFEVRAEKTFPHLSVETCRSWISGSFRFICVTTISLALSPHPGATQGSCFMFFPFHLFAKIIFQKLNQLICLLIVF